MRLYLVRHGEAEPAAERDETRALTRRGRRAVEDLWGALAREGVQPARLVSSPYRRARQTADCIAARYPEVPRETTDLLVPEAEPGAVIAWLSGRESVDGWVLVSHMPLVAQVTGLLVQGLGGRGSFGIGSVACLDLEVVAPSCARLLWQRGPG